MSDRQFDFGLFGSSLLTRLLAGLLASVHGKSVLLVGESQARFRLSRDLNLSIAPLTRPQTWELLGTLVPETTRLIARAVGRGSIGRTDPIFFADTVPGKEALSHIRHMALAFGHAAEKVAPTLLGGARDGVVFRDAVLLNSGDLEPLLDAWLDRLSVVRTGRLDSSELHADGSGTVGWGKDEASFRQTVLCDDAAVAEYFATAPLPPSLELSPGTTVLCQAVEPLAAPVMHQIDTGLTLLQPRGQALVVMGPGRMDALVAEVTELLGRRRVPRQIGQVEYRCALGRDGGPILGTLGEGPAIIAGLGAAGAFFAPALARALCGVASSAEAYWFATHAAGRDPVGSTVSEWKAA